jgi:predicted histone-like DNA-binding protein
MPVQYTVVAKGNPSDPKAPKKFYAQAKSSGEISLRDLANQISKRSTLSTVDVVAVLEAMIEVIPERISEGDIVRLGDFGSFSLTISSNGSEKETDVTVANIRDNSLNFRPGKQIQKILDVISYKKMAS